MPKAAAEKKDGNRKPVVVKRKRRVAAAGYKLPDPIEPGEIVTDVLKRKWKLGKSVGVGGFGEIYMASDDVTKAAGQDCRYVVKIEPHENGPLWTEMHFYHKVAKPELIDNWIATRKLRFLGMPRFIGSGSHEYKGIKYRFMVMERFGKDVQKLIEANGKKLSLKTVLTLGMKILDVLEFIHSQGYIHADIKGANLLLGYEDKTCEKVYLVDYGLACRYAKANGAHKEYREDPRKAHDGTIEYLSRDAHKGVHSRRGDLEILGYNMVHWLSSKLPWDDNLENPNEVHAAKSKYMMKVSKPMEECFGKFGASDSVARYLEYVANLGFGDEPNYEYCRCVLREGLQQAKLKNDGKLEFDELIAKVKKRKSVTEYQESDDDGDMPGRITRAREPKSPTTTDRLKKPSTAKVDKKRKELPPIKLENPTPAMLLVLKQREDRHMRK